MKLIAYGDMDIKPTGDYLYFRKCFNDHVRDGDGKVILFRPDQSVDTTNWCELIGIGPRCKVFKGGDVGGFCLLPEMTNGMHRLGSVNEDVNGEVVQNEDFAIREEVLVDHFPAICR